MFNNPWFDYSTIFKTSHIIDFATLTGQGSLGKLVETTFWFGMPSWTSGTNDVFANCVSNAGSQIKFGLFNSGSGCLIYDGGSKIILAEYDTGFYMTSSQSSEIGIQGLASGQTTWLRFVGQLSGNNKNEQRNFGTDGVSSSFPNCAYGTAIPDVGSKFSYGLHYRCIRRTYDFSSDSFDLQGMLGCAGVNTSVKFEIECHATNANVIPSLYQRGQSSPTHWWHKVTIWELVDVS